MAERKRIRNPNFSSKEKRILLECAFEEKNVIENKKTDGVTWKEKESAWERIGVSFNAHSDCVFRSVEALKKFYQGYKKEMRKVAADERLSINKTEGGKPSHIMTDENFDLAISVMNPKTIIGLDNVFDGDAAIIFEDEFSSTMIEEKQQCETTPDWSTYKPSQLKNPVHPKLKSLDKDKPESISEDIETKSHIPMSKGFKKQYTVSADEQEVGNKWCGRRRPVAATLPSGKITEQYSQLSAIKIELAKLQLEEATQTKYSNSIEQELRKRNLKLDIQIKTEVLKRIKTDSCKCVLKDFNF